MGIFSVAKNYLVWHYSTAYHDLIRIWWNYIWFVNHLFSVPDVLRSWFAPFKRLQEEKVNLLMHPEAYFSNFFVNLIMRVVGFMLRTALLGMALVSFVFVISLGIFMLVLWTALPVLIADFIINSIGQLLS